LTPFWYSYSETCVRPAERFLVRQWIKNPGLVRALKLFYPPLRMVTITTAGR
jgi:hypothetical protein